MAWPSARSIAVTVEHLADRGFDAFVGAGDDELDAAQAPPRQLAQERGPERLGFGRTDVHAEHLWPAVAVDPDRDDHRDRDVAPVLAHLYVGGVDPQVGPITLDRAIEEGLQLVVDLTAQP